MNTETNRYRWKVPERSDDEVMPEGLTDETQQLAVRNDEFLVTFRKAFPWQIITLAIFGCRSNNL